MLRNNRYKVCCTNTAYYDVFEIHHHFDERGDHRLEIEGRVSAWGLYGEIVTFKHKDVLFGATTEYYWPDLPEVFAIHVLKRHEEMDAEPEQEEEKPEEPKRPSFREQLEQLKAKRRNKE